MSHKVEINNKFSVLSDITDFKRWLDFKREIISKWIQPDLRLKGELLNKIEKASQLKTFNESKIQEIVNYIDVRVDTKMEKSLNTLLHTKQDDFLTNVDDLKYIKTEKYGDYAAKNVLEEYKLYLEKMPSVWKMKVHLERYIDIASYYLESGDDKVWQELTRFNLNINNAKSDIQTYEKELTIKGLENLNAANTENRSKGGRNSKWINHRNEILPILLNYIENPYNMDATILIVQEIFTGPNSQNLEAIKPAISTIKGWISTIRKDGKFLNIPV